MSASGLQGVRQVVVGVVETELVRLGLTGIVVSSPPAPECEVISHWLEGVCTVRIPDAGTTADVAGALAVAGAPAQVLEGMAWRVAAEALAAAEGLLPVGGTNKASLLLDPSPLPARVLPLGDVWPSVIRRAFGSASLPPVLVGASPDEVGRVEGALQAYLAGGASPEAALAPLGALAGPVREALDASEWRRRGLLVPKLEPWTAGADLAR